MARLHQSFIKSDKISRMQYRIHHKKLINTSIKKIFFIDVFQSWIKYNEKLVVGNEVILKSPIFYNKNILIGGQTINILKPSSNWLLFKLIISDQRLIKLK